MENSIMINNEKLKENSEIKLSIGNLHGKIC